MNVNEWLKTVSDQWGPDLPIKPEDAARLAWAACQRTMFLELWDALPAHEKTGDTAGSLRAMLLFSEVGDEIRTTRMREPCSHMNAVEQATCDGSRVLFCPDCGKNLSVHTFG